MKHIERYCFCILFCIVFLFGLLRYRSGIRGYMKSVVLDLLKQYLQVEMQFQQGDINVYDNYIKGSLNSVFYLSQHWFTLVRSSLWQMCYQPERAVQTWHEPSAGVHLLPCSSVQEEHLSHNAHSKVSLSINPDVFIRLSSLHCTLIERNLYIVGPAVWKGFYISRRANGHSEWAYAAEQNGELKGGLESQTGIYFYLHFKYLVLSGFKTLFNLRWPDNKNVQVGFKIIFWFNISWTLLTRKVIPLA